MIRDDTGDKGGGPLVCEILFVNNNLLRSPSLAAGGGDVITSGSAGHGADVTDSARGRDVGTVVVDLLEGKTLVRISPDSLLATLVVCNPLVVLLGTAWWWWWWWWLEDDEEEFSL